MFWQILGANGILLALGQLLSLHVYILKIINGNFCFTVVHFVICYSILLPAVNCYFFLCVGVCVCYLIFSCLANTLNWFLKICIFSLPFLISFTVGKYVSVLGNVFHCWEICFTVAKCECSSLLWNVFHYWKMWLFWDLWLVFIVGKRDYVLLLWNRVVFCCWEMLLCFTAGKCSCFTV